MDNPKTSFQGLKWRVGVSTVVAAVVWSRRPGMAAAGVQKFGQEVQEELISSGEEVEVPVEAAGVGSLEFPVEAGQEQAGEEDAKGEEKSPTPKAKKDKKSKKKSKKQKPSRSRSRRRRSGPCKTSFEGLKLCFEV